MEKKPAKFDPESAFKSIVGLNDSIEEETKEETPQGKKVGRPRLNQERKKTVAITVYPSSYNDLKKIAYVDRQSTSEVIGNLIEQYIKENEVIMYDTFMTKWMYAMFFLAFCVILKRGFMDINISRELEKILDDQLREFSEEQLRELREEPEKYKKENEN